MPSQLPPEQAQMLYRQQGPPLSLPELPKGTMPHGGGHGGTWGEQGFLSVPTKSTLTPSPGKAGTLPMEGVTL